MIDYSQEENVFPCYEGTEPYIFISYKHDDPCYSESFNNLLNRFFDGGYRVWYDPTLRSGEDWGNQLIERIKNAHVFLGLTSNLYYQSKDCKTELFQATSEDMRLLPVEAEEVTIDDYRQKYITANYQKITSNYIEKILNHIWITECMQDAEKRKQQIQKAEKAKAEQGAKSKPEKQIITASSAQESMSREFVERKVDKLFADSAIKIAPTTQEKRFFFSKPKLIFTPDEITQIMEGILNFLRMNQNDLRLLLYGVDFQGSRMAYKTALTTVVVVERIAKYYDFWTYQQNQKIHYFISDSAPLLRLMHGRAVRDEHRLSENMVAAVKNFASELDRLIDCLEG